MSGQASVKAIVPDIYTITAIRNNDAVYDYYGSENTKRRKEFNKSMDWTDIWVKIKFDVSYFPDIVVGDTFTLDDGKSKKDYRIVRIQKKSELTKN